MVSLGEIIVIVSFIWLTLIVIANRVDLQQYGLLISSGFLLFIPDIFTKMINKLASYDKFWDKLGRIFELPAFILFLAAPLVLSINLVKGIFFRISPIFNIHIVEIFRVENFLLILPVLMIYLSIQMLVMAIYAVIDGNEIDRSGLLLIGVILTFFASTTGEQSKARKTKAISVIVISQLIIVGVSIPLSWGVHSGMNNLYDESQGAIIASIYPNSPADQSNLEVSMIITNIILPEDNLNIAELNVTSSARLNRILAQIPAGTEFIIKTNSSQFNIVGTTPPEDVAIQTGSYLGLITKDYRTSSIRGLTPLLPFWIDLAFDWLINIGLLFGFYSLLPMPRTQGYQLMGYFADEFEFDINLKVRQIISVLALLVFSANIAFYLL